MSDSVQITMGQNQQLEEGLDDQINALKQNGIDATNIDEFYTILSKYIKLRNKIQQLLISEKDFENLEQTHISNMKRKNGIKSIINSLAEVKTELDTIIEALGGKISQRLRENYKKTKSQHFDYHMSSIDELNFLGSELIMYQSIPNIIQRLRTLKHRKEIKRKIDTIETKEQLLFDNFKKIESEFNNYFDSTINCIRNTVSSNLFQFLAIFDESITTFDDFKQKARAFYEAGDSETFKKYSEFINSQIVRKQQDLGELLKSISSEEQRYSVQQALRTTPSKQIDKTNLTPEEREEYIQITTQFPDIEYINLNDIAIVIENPSIREKIKISAKIKKKVPEER